MKPTSCSPLLVNAALCAGVAIAALATAMSAAQANVGVAAAVNVDARGKPPGGAARVLTLGESVIFNEEIATDGAGLVQILLLDGTTFTVGPNSRLIIDEFIYNPDTGEAKVVASVTKGAFRFIGAKTSEKAGGATIRTPVGLIGIRGAIVEGHIGEGDDPTTFSLVSGKEVTFTGKDGEKARIYKVGYTLVVDGDDGDTKVRPRTDEDAMTSQTGLAGNSDQSGGNDHPPTNEDLDGVSQVGSQQLPEEMSPPDLRPVEASTIETAEDNVAEIDLITQGENRQEIVEDQAEDQDDDEEETPPFPTQNARLLLAPLIYETFEGYQAPQAGSRGLVGSTPETDRIVAFAKANGRLMAQAAGIDLPDLTGTQGDGGLAAISASGTSPYGPVSGTAYAGRGDFVTYFLGINGDPEQPFYLIYGTPTNEAALIAMDVGTDIREYTLTQDPIRQTPVPFFANDLYGTVSNYNSSNFIVVESGNSDLIRALQSWVSIDGSGASQRSAAHVVAGVIYQGQNGQYQFDAARRGTYRYDALQGPINMRGGVSTIAGASGGEFFGSNAEHFVIGQPLDPPDSYADPSLGPAYTGDPNDGYAGDGFPFGTHHVASLMSETPQASYTRTTREVFGFISGMAEGDVEGTENPYALTDDSSEGAATNFTLRTDAGQNTLFAYGDLYDTQDDSPVVAGMLVAFGGENGDGDSTFVDDSRFGAYTNTDPQNTRLLTDTGGDIADIENFNPGSYLVSGRANPIAGYQHCTQCDFVDWGWWGTRVATAENVPEGVNEDRNDFVHMGTWVAGDITDPLDLPFGGTGFYDGTALGTVARDMGSGDVAKYIAAGDVHMEFDFADRTGSLQINNFDNMNVSAGIAENSNGTQALFSGGLTGVGLLGETQGAFVNDGSNAAAGAIGSFNFGGSGVSAVGTFVTEQTDFAPPN